MPEAIFALLIGLLIGSFLNVCIYRLPRDLSVVRPRSFCPACKHPIAWYDNIPVVGYLRLRAGCRHCGTRISARYPLVELLTGALFMGSVLVSGPTAGAVKLCLLSALMVGLIFSDLEERILPDELTLGGAVLGIALAWVVPVEDFIARVLISLYGVNPDPRWVSVAEAALGALLPSAFLWLAGFLFEKIRHKEGLGLGDVKMMAAIGAFLGVHGALLTLVVGSLLGSVIGLAYILLTRKDAGTYQLPFGTFLGAAAVIVGFYLQAGSP
jgi:leader peptidase (prepilin peptidase) / N-methyltransferase